MKLFETLFSAVTFLWLISACSNPRPARLSYWESMKDSFPLRNVQKFASDSTLEANYKTYPKIKNSLLDSVISRENIYLYSWQERDTSKNEFTVLLDDGELGLKLFYLVFTKHDSLLSYTQLSGSGGEAGTRYETRSHFLSKDTLFQVGTITQFYNHAGPGPQMASDSTFSRLYFDKSGKVIEEIIPAPKPAINFSGSWSWSAADTSAALWLDLIQSGDSITGAYCAFQRGGMRYDCGETGDPVCPVRGIINGNKAFVFFTSCYSGETGKAELIYDAEKETLTWKVVDGKLQHYAQQEATLKKSVR